VPVPLCANTSLGASYYETSWARILGNIWIPLQDPKYYMRARYFTIHKPSAPHFLTNSKKAFFHDFNKDIFPDHAGN